MRTTTGTPAYCTTGNTVEETGLGYAIGAEDRLCRPVPGSLRPVGWQDRPMAQLPLSMELRLSLWEIGPDGEPWPGLEITRLVDAEAALLSALSRAERERLAALLRRLSLEFDGARDGSH